MRLCKRNVRQTIDQLKTVMRVITTDNASAAAAATETLPPTASDGVNHGESSERRIRSFAVIDFETSNLPNYNYNRVGITEMSIWAFSAAELLKKGATSAVPQPPRILHKLTLLFNPMMRIDPDAERITGLSNEALEDEAPFNENAHSLFEAFLKHLPGPVCLVAHNGHGFDFPVIKHVLEKIPRDVPANVLCLDSLHAFQDIDEIRKTEQLAVKIAEESESKLLGDAEVASESSPEATPKDYKKLNETTPHRRTHPYEGRPSKSHNSTKIGTPEKNLHFRRSLFASPNGGGKFKRRFIPRNVYRLGNVYERVFGEPPAVAHHAEADVEVLMKIMQYYGPDFLHYAEENAISFADLPRLGANR